MATPLWLRWLHSTLTRRQTARSRSKAKTRGTFLRPLLERLEDRLAPVADVFTNPLGGDWSVGTNWSLGAPPTASQDATINLSGGAVVDMSGSLNYAGPMLTVSGNCTLLVSGTLTGGTVSVTNGAVMSVIGGATLDGVTVNGNLSINYGAVRVEDGLTLNGTATIADGANGLYFVGTQTLGGNGTVVIGNAAVGSYPNYDYNYLYTDAAASTLTIGPSITVSGNVGVIGGYYGGSYTTSGGPIVNEGTIQADVSGGTITLLGSGWQNPGTLLATNGGTLSLQGTGTNSGSIIGAAGTYVGLSGDNVTLTPTSSITADSLSLAASQLNLQMNGPTAGSGFPDITANTLAMGGNLNVELMNGFTPSLGETFTIINHQGSQPISGTFAGSTVSAGSTQFQISSTGSDGNNVILTTTALANAGGPYTVTYGGSLALNASASGDLNSSALTYSWTINGQANAAGGVQPVVTWAQLQSLGASTGEAFSVRVTISDGNSLVLTSAPVTVTVNQATPIVAVTDVGGAYNGLPHAATATVAGVVTGVDNTPAASLEGVTPTLTYYVGTTTGGTALSGAPTGAGTYTVVAFFAGSADYGAASADATFTINVAMPTVAVTDAGGTYNGSAFAASATASSTTVGATVASILVPAYFYPTPGGSPWDQLTAAAATTPIMAIMNPDSGPGSAADPNYVAAVDRLRAAGGKVIGYVATDYGAVPLATVEAQIDEYRTWYNLDGIFVDQMTNDGSDLAYYQAIYQYVHSQQPGWIVVGNPGSNTSEAYAQLPVADVLVLFENGSGYDTYTPPSWQQNYPAERFANIVYGVPDASTMQADVQEAAAQNTGWVYFTDDSLPNPYDTLPSYFTQLAAAAGAPAGAGGQEEVNGAFTFTFTDSQGNTSGTAPTSAGTYSVQATFTSNDLNYANTTSSALSFTISQATPVITWNNPSAPVNITYGTALANGQLSGGSASWTLNGGSVTVPGTFTYTSAAGSVLNASASGQSEAVTFTPIDTTDYTTASSTVTVNVAKASPTVVSVNPVNITYGTALANSQLSGTATWTVGGNSVTVPGTFTYTSAAGTVLGGGNGQSEDVTFTPSDSADYSSVSTTVTVNVTPATLTIAPTAGQSKIYGAGVPTLTYTASGFVNGDPVSTLTGSLGTTAASASPVGTYAFTLGSLTAGANYTVVLAANAPTFAVTPAPLTITPTAGQSRLYGAAVPTLTYTASGFVNNDPTSLLTGTLGTTATAASSVGIYAFTTGSLTASGNYTVVLAANAPTFAVTPAPLTVTANNVTIIQGEAYPAFTVTYNGFVLGQDSSVLGGTLTFSTTAPNNTTPGTYALTPSGLTSSNYAITFLPGKLTILSYGQATTGLQTQVDAAGLNTGTASSLDTQLEAAIAYFAAGDTTDGVSQLGAFINHVSAQRGTHIAAALADAWIAEARRIINAVG